MSFHINCTKSNHRFSFFLHLIMQSFAIHPILMNSTWKWCFKISNIENDQIYFDSCFVIRSVSFRTRMEYHPSFKLSEQILGAWCSLLQRKKKTNIWIFFHWNWKIEEGKKRSIERGYDKNMNKMSMQNPNRIHEVWTILSHSLYVLFMPLLLLLFWVENSLCERALSSDFNLDKYEVTKIHQIDNLCIQCTVYSVQCAQCTHSV